MRHLPTLNNEQDYITGQHDVDIIRNGKEKAIQFDGIVYTSPLKRCSNTIKIKLETSQNVIHFDDRLLERNMGEFEGKKRKAIIYQYPTYFISGKFNVFLQPPGGESFAKFYERVISFYEDVVKKRNEDMLICSHNQTLKLLKCILEKKELSINYWCSCNFINGEIYEIEERE